MTRSALLAVLLLGCEGTDDAPSGDGGAIDAVTDDRPLSAGDVLTPPADGGRAGVVDGPIGVGDAQTSERVLAALEAPAEVGDCEVLVLDASLSTGRSLSYAWTVDAPDDAPAGLGELVASAVGPVLVLPPQVLPPGVRLGFAVTARDPDGRSDTVHVDVDRKPLAPPVVGLEGPDHVETHRGDPLDLAGSARAVDCDGTPRLLILSWSSDPPVGIDATTPELHLPPGTLEVDETYALTLTAWPAGAPESRGLASVEVAVVRSALQAHIAGGDRAHPVDRPLELDARGSRDPDSAEATLLPAAGYQFVWGCEREDEQPCGVDFPEEPVVAAEAGALRLGVHHITLQVSDGARVAEAMARLELVAAPCRAAGPPVVAIAPPPGLKADPGQDLWLQAAVVTLSDEPASLTWSETNGRLDLEDGAVALEGRHGASLGIAAAALVPGTIYRLRLDARDCGGVGSDEQRVPVNAPPALGGCSAEPDGGDEVVVRCEAWSDDDLPLSYSLGYSSRGLRFPLVPPGPDPVLRFSRPPGVQAVVVTIRDALELGVDVEVPLP